MNPTEVRKIPLSIVWVGVILPTIITWVYFDLLAHSAPWLQRTAYGIGKSCQVALLAFASFGWRSSLTRRALDSSSEGVQPSDACTRVRGTDLSFGLISGIAISLVIALLYYFVMHPWGAMDTVREVSKTKIDGLVGDSRFALLGVAIFYALIHSGFEELYWRGFVFQALRTYVTLWQAVIASSLGFMAHHVLVLGRYFGYDSPWTYLAAMGVAIGGVLWAMLLVRSKSLFPSWISHAVVDATLFGVGFHLISA